MNAAQSKQPDLVMMPTGESHIDLVSLLAILQQYRIKTGVYVESMPAYHSVQTRLKLLQYLFAQKSSQPDICEVDNIWPGDLADDLMDLTPYVGEELKDIDPAMTDAFKVDGKLVALPLFMTTSVLYYRTDLLKKYGFDGPPQTWEQLGHMARVIQDGERKRGAADFWGYVWPAALGENLTCSAMEWERSEGTSLIDSSRRVCALNPAAERAVKRARGWVGTISPPSVVEYDEEDTDSLWLSGSVAFSRGWLYLASASNSSKKLAGKFATAPLPAGSKGRAWTFGGMGIGVSKYSKNPEAAVRLVRYMVSLEVQLDRLKKSSTLPVRTSLLRQESVLRDTPLTGWFGQHWQEGMFSRPSNMTGKKYDAVSHAYSEAIHDSLAGTKDTHVALEALQQEIVSITGLAAANPQ